MAAKIVVLGSLNGNIEPAFQKLSALHAKNHFTFALITGNLFAAEQDAGVVARLLGADIGVPLSTYFTVGTVPLPDPVVERIESGEEICENLHYLGKRSVTKTSDGIRIVTLGGVLDSSIVGGQSKEQHLPLHTLDDAKSLRGANNADILLSSLWPANVWTNSKITLTPENQASINGSEAVADLCAALKPRYHFSFSPADFFYEREPFFYLDSEVDASHKPVTRFIAMAPMGNSAKAKAVYAFNLRIGESSTAVPVGSTLSPFTDQLISRKRPASDNHDGYSRFQKSDDHYRRTARRRRERSPPPGPDQCFFCLGNPKLETHMICAIGDESYITTAKGPLSSSDTFAAVGLNFPCHQLIIPFAHEPTMRSVPSDMSNTYSEMLRMKEALQAMVSSKSNHKLGAVTWEISRARGIHFHWQFFPMPIQLLRGGIVMAGFKVEAENLKYNPLEIREIGSGADEPGDYFRLWIWSDDGETSIQGKELVMRIDDTFRFDLQYARRVVAKLLGLESRINWRDIGQTTAEEVEDVTKFKESFKPWDFTLQKD